MWPLCRNYPRILLWKQHSVLVNSSIPSHPYMKTSKYHDCKLLRQKNLVLVNGSISSHPYLKISKYHDGKILRQKFDINCHLKDHSWINKRCKNTSAKVRTRPREPQVQRRDVNTAKPFSLMAELSLKEDLESSRTTVEPGNNEDSNISSSKANEERPFQQLENLFSSTSFGNIDLALEPSHSSFNLPLSLREHLPDIEAGEYDLFSGPDPSVPMSDVPCPGCGALLHCQNPGIPGYMPSQRFLGVSPEKLREIICQRCLLMKEHNLALNLSVPPEKYREIVSQVRNQFALVLVLVDVMDLPNSIFPNLSELIGKKRPLYVVGNKVDQLPMDRKGYLERTKNYLLKVCNDAGLTTENHVKHTCLISAKTGYGVEELVTRLMKDWARKGHVYILGCTNVGKSSLFNMLLSSDYCKSTARHFIHRATTSVWPGTTLNLLKFPIVDPAPWRLHLRAKRLLKQRSTEVEEEILRRRNVQGKPQNATLLGHVGQTFVTSAAANPRLKYAEDRANIPSYTFSGSGFVADHENPADHLAEYEETRYAKSRWCYDTPGVVNEQQVINRLTQEELSILLTGKLIQPRSFAVKPGYVMFASGLGRIDYVKGPKTICLTLVASEKIPVHVMKYEKADEFYQENVGSHILGLPIGGQDRLNRLPSLIGREFHITGIGSSESIADLLLSSLGWVAVTADTGSELTLRVYTPGGLGCMLRQPALLPYAVNLKGRRIRGTPVYRV